MNIAVVSPLRTSHGGALWVGLLSLVVAGVCSPAMAQEDPALVGKWDPPPGGYDWPLEAMHAVHLSTGNIVVWKNPDNPVCPHEESAWLWNPVSGSFTNVAPNPASFQTFDCAGHAAVADGSILVAGGGCGPVNAHNETAIFSMSSGPWTVVAPMNYRRWYATCTTLPDNRVLAISGAYDYDFVNEVYLYVTRPEIYIPGTPDMWVEMGQPADKQLPLYPFMFVLPQQDKVFYAGPRILTYHSTLRRGCGPTWILAGR